MADQAIICSFCSKEIPLTEAISHQVREELLKDFETKARKKEQELIEVIERFLSRKATIGQLIRAFKLVKS